MLVTNNTNQDYWFGPLHIAPNASGVTVDDTSATSLYLTDDGVADAINYLYQQGKISVSGAAAPFPRATGTPEVLHGDGSPEGLVYGAQGSIYLRRDNAGSAQLYQKTTGRTLNTGWVAVSGSPTTAPPGAIEAYGGASAPTGWLLCDGSAVSRTTYADLFAAIGTAFGSGDGSTTFNLPDGRGRTLVGKGTNASVNAVGANDGVAVANRRPHHRHTPHTHTVPTQNSGSNLYGGGSFNAAQSGTETSSSVDGGSGVSTDSLDAPAFLVVNYIVKT